MTILVTGAGGFVGCAVVEHLAARGNRVVAVDMSVPAFSEPDQVTTITGNLTEPETLDACFAMPPTSIVHLAAVPGGTAETDPDLSFEVNVKATIALMRRAAQTSASPRFVYASSIAVFGDPLPASGVSDGTALRPKLYYGVHKLMAEEALANFNRRNELSGVGIRLPGIVARPLGPSGMKSAFMSNIFHAINAGESITLPVRKEATLWLMSVECCVKNILHALDVNTAVLPERGVVTLPAIYVNMEGLVEEIARHCPSSASSVLYDSDEALERAFGAHPTLTTALADAAGFSHDGSVENLVKNVLGRL